MRKLCFITLALLLSVSVCQGQLFMKDVLFDRFSTGMLFKGSDVADPPEWVKIGTVLYYNVAQVQYRSGEHGEDLTAAYTMKVTVGGIERGFVALSVFMMLRQGAVMGESLLVNPGAAGFWMRKEYLAPRVEPDFGLKVSPGNIVELFDVNTNERLYQAVYNDQGLLLSVKFTRGPEGVKGSIKEVAQLIRTSSVPEEFIPERVKVPDWFKPGIVFNCSFSLTEPWTGISVPGEMRAVVYRIGKTWAEVIQTANIAGNIETKKLYSLFGLGACDFWADLDFLSRLAEREAQWVDDVLQISTRVYRSNLEGTDVIVVEDSSLVTSYKAQLFYDVNTGLKICDRHFVPSAFGAPEVFELRLVNRETVDLSAADSDNDGFSDLDEVKAMTDPFDSKDFPRRDTVPPTLNLNSPQEGEISPDASFRLSFPEPIDQESLKGAVELLEDGRKVQLELVYDPEAHTLTVAPKEPFKRGSKVKLIVRGTVRDLAGNTLDGNGNGVPEGSPKDDVSFEFQVAEVRWDLNGDGEVDIFDMVIVAGRFGKKSEEADLNGDGVVDIFDLVIIAKHMGGGAQSAPPLLSDLLLQNYPNPCNPGTWIPFVLSKPSEVRIRIYDPRGKLIRELDLGFREAGLYIERGKAAYWDGRDSLGFKVPSGVYFVELVTGRSKDLRKLAVLR